MEPPEQEESWRENSGIYKARFEIIEGMLHKGVGFEKQRANLELLYASQRSINFEIPYLSEKLDSGLSLLLSIQLDLEGQQQPKQEQLEEVKILEEMNERVALEIERLTAHRDEVLVLICQYEDILHHDDEALARSLQAEIQEKPIVQVPKKFIRNTSDSSPHNRDVPIRRCSDVYDMNPIFEINLNLRILQKLEYKIAKLPSGQTTENYIRNRFYKAKDQQVELAFLRFKYESWPEGMSWHDWLLARMAMIADPKTLLCLWGLFWATISNYDVQEIYLSRPKCNGELCKLQHKRWLQVRLSEDAASLKRSAISPSEVRARLVYWQQEQVAEICASVNVKESSLSIEDLLRADNIHFVSTLVIIHSKLRDDFIQQFVYCITSDFLKKVKPEAIAFLWATVANFEQSDILNSWLSSVLVQTIAPLIYQTNHLYYTGWQELSRGQLDQLIDEL